MIIAVDFDGVLCEDKWPEIGEEISENIEQLKWERASGAKIILWTCRTGELLDEALEWCKERGILFDAVNENLPERVEKYHNDCRKVSADQYWDDKAVNKTPGYGTALDCHYCVHDKGCTAPAEFLCIVPCERCEYGGGCIGCIGHSHFEFIGVDEDEEQEAKP